MDWNQRDHYYLRVFGANLEHKTLLKQYEKLRAIWKGAELLGELPQATLLDLAAKYQNKKVETEADGS
tara:strand:+ start:326 stop:529 length:204 start_codon:yes stop_codon:yes gene_type:complete